MRHQALIPGYLVHSYSDVLVNTLTMWTPVTAMPLSQRGGGHEVCMLTRATSQQPRQLSATELNLKQCVGTSSNVAIPLSVQLGGCWPDYTVISSE